MFKISFEIGRKVTYFGLNWVNNLKEHLEYFSNTFLVLSLELLVLLMLLLLLLLLLLSLLLSFSWGQLYPVSKISRWTKGLKFRFCLKIKFGIDVFFSETRSYFEKAFRSFPPEFSMILNFFFCMFKKNKLSAKYGVNFPKSKKLMSTLTTIFPFSVMNIYKD